MKKYFFLLLYPFFLFGFDKGTLNLETAVQDDKVMRDFDSESLLMGGDHSQKVKAPPTKSDYGSKDRVNLSSSTAVSRLTKTVSSITNTPFQHTLAPTLIPANNSEAPVLLTLHGYGGDASLGQILKTFNLPYHIVSFNFPDYSLYDRRIANNKTTFGTIQELLPFLYMLKKLVVDGNLNSINLYGFSAGGGALINGIAVLNSNRFNNELQTIGIDFKEKEQILRAVQNGKIILDAPLKSMRELMRKRKDSADLQAIARRYTSNNLEPIDSLYSLSPLALHVVVYFEVPDQAVLNDDDALFEQRLREANRNGTSVVIRGHSGGHLEYHKALWDTLRP